MFNHTGSSPAGGQWCPAPHLKSVPPHSTFGPPVAAYIQYCILKMWSPFCFFAPPSGFWHQLLLNLGDGPATSGEILKPSRPISPRAATEKNDFVSGEDFPTTPLRQSLRGHCFFKQHLSTVVILYLFFSMHVHL